MREWRSEVSGCQHHEVVYRCFLVFVGLEALHPKANDQSSGGMDNNIYTIGLCWESGLVPYFVHASNNIFELDVVVHRFVVTQPNFFDRPLRCRLYFLGEPLE
jgi:hypothetical protein